jgi:uncharacterized protein involved in exopolysaccharide biosynthesis
MDEHRPFADVRRAIHGVLSVLSLHRWAFFVPGCLVTSVAFVLSLYYPRMYSATTTFERRHDPIFFDLPLSAGAAASFNYFRTTMHSDLTSPATMTEVVDNLGLTKNYARNPDESFTEDSLRSRNALARSVGSRLTIGRTSPNEQLDIIGITYTGPDPTIGKRLVEEVRRVYTRRVALWMREFLERQRDYFAQQAQEAMEELKQAQREETKLRMDNPYVNPSDPGAISTRLSQLEIERREMHRRRREREAELFALQQMAAMLEPHADSGSAAPLPAPGELESPEIRRMRDQQHELNKEAQRLRSTRGMTDEHPEMKELQAKNRQLESAVEQLRERLRQHGTDEEGARASGPLPIPMAIPSPLQGERARLAAQIDAENEKIADLDAGLQSNELAAAELQRAKDQLYENQDAFHDVLAKVNQAKQRSAQLDSTVMSIEPAINALSQERLMQFSEGQSARGSSIPVSPKAQTIVLLALLAGLAAGALCVILAEVLDHVYRSSSQVARSLGLPILEAIDEIITVQDRRRLLIRRAVVAPLVIVSLLATTGLSGSMAYVSLQRPWRYQQLQRIPQAAARLFGLTEHAPADARTREPSEP